MSPYDQTAPWPPEGPSWEEWGPLREYDVEERLLEQRIVLLSGHLNDDLANRTISRLLVLGRGREPVELHLTCDRSELAGSLALADAVDMVQAPVNALVRGALRGPAVAVLSACQHRAAHHHALFVLSLPGTDVPPSSTTEVVHLSEQRELQERQLRARIVAASGRTDEQVADDLRTGRFLTAQEARHYGLVQEIA